VSVGTFLRSQSNEEDPMHMPIPTSCILISVHDSSARIDEVCSGHSAELLRQEVGFSQQAHDALRDAFCVL
jgi:hypothetical protein